MPPAGSAAADMQVQRRQALSNPPFGTNYAPTGATQVAQIEIPQGMIASGVNTNDYNSLVWTVWNDVYTNTVTITQTINSASAITSGTNNMTLNATWSAWNVQLQNALTNSNIIGQQMTAATSGLITQTITTTLNAEVWGQWNQQLQNIRGASAEQVRETQRRAQEQQARYQADQARVTLERTLAEKRAEKLLQETLSAQQREELASKGFFTLKTIAKSGEERIYRIRRGRSRNVEQVDVTGNRIKTLCAHPAAPVPDADTMLAQKLMLEGPESQEEFLRIANHS